MPAERIVFGPNQASGDSQLAGASPSAINVCIDGTGAVRRRPGLAAFASIPGTQMPGPVTAMGNFGAENATLFASLDGTETRLFALQNGVFLEVSTADPLTRVDGAGRPVFAETPQAAVVIADGLPQKVTLGLTSQRLGGTPPPGLGIAAIASRVVVDDKTNTSTRGRFRWSGLGLTGIDVWDPLNFNTAEAQADAVMMIAENSNELFVFGERTLQIYSPDAVQGFAPGRTQNRGMLASYSLVKADEAFAWLTDKKEFVMSDGRSTEVISAPIQRTLDNLTAWSDCFGYRVKTDQFDVFVWTFPTDGRTFAYQVGGGWSEWFGWSGGFQAFSVTTSFRTADGTVLAGLNDGRVARFSGEANDDLGGILKAQVTSGFVTHGSDRMKRNVALRLSLKRGHTTSATDMFISWRDDQGAFVDPIRVPLDGDYDPVVEFRSLGVYRRRQWRVEFTAGVEFELAGVEEEFEVLRN